MVFSVESPDWALSPHTGMVRRHWRACGVWLLERMFGGLASPEAPLVFPKVPGKTYPRPEDPPWKVRAEALEGLVRSLNLAGPLLEEDPDLEVRGWSLREYYMRELRAMLLPGGARVIPPQEAFPRDEMVQMTCELGALATIFLLCPGLWRRFSRAEQDAVAGLMAGYAHGSTGAHNWRYFNVMMMVFLRHAGYAVDERLAQAHLDALMACDAGQGWFRDAHFDYYNAWVFHLYAPIWCEFFGYKHNSGLAAKMEAQGRALAASYPWMYGRDGRMLMWGRSIAYRTAAAAPLAALHRFRASCGLDPGWSRRICSGNLLQFVTRADFLHHGVPALGFYGHFEPALQSYSCAGSPMWMYLNFLAALSLPEAHPFWTTKENEGGWSEIGNGVAERVLEAPGLCLSNHGRCGSTVLRPGKAEPDDANYNRLAYHTAFPWEESDPALGTAMHVARRSAWWGPDFKPPVRLYWAGHQDGVLYRQAILSWKTQGCPAAVDLADVALPQGLLRVDRPRLYHPGELRLAHYGLPHVTGPALVERRTVGDDLPVITARIPGRQLALIALQGWDRLEAAVHRGFHPEAEESTLLYACAEDRERFPGLHLKILLMLHKCDDTPWTEEELMPVKSWKQDGVSGSALDPLRIELRDGRLLSVDFAGLEGRLTL